MPRRWMAKSRRSAEVGGRKRQRGGFAQVCLARGASIHVPGSWVSLKWTTSVQFSSVISRSYPALTPPPALNPAPPLPFNHKYRVLQYSDHLSRTLHSTRPIVFYAHEDETPRQSRPEARRVYHCQVKRETDIHKPDQAVKSRQAQCLPILPRASHQPRHCRSQTRSMVGRCWRSWGKGALASLQGSAPKHPRLTVCAARVHVQLLWQGVQGAQHDDGGACGRQDHFCRAGCRRGEPRD